MKCRECPIGRRFAVGSVYCRTYGMIIREDHECTLKGGLRREDGDADHRDNREEGTELQEDGERAAGFVPRILRGSGE